MARNFVVKKEFKATLKSPRNQPHQTVASQMYQLLKRHSKPLASINKCVRKSMKLVVTIRLSGLKRKLKILESMCSVSYVRVISTGPYDENLVPNFECLFCFVFQLTLKSDLKEVQFTQIYLFWIKASKVPQISKLGWC